MSQRNRGKTTMTFRLLPEEKLELIKSAREMDLSSSQYAEILILGQHNQLLEKRIELEKESSKPELDLLLDDYQIQFVNAALKALKRKFPKESLETLLLASVFQVFNNERSFVKDKLEDSLSKVKQKIKKHKSKNHD